MKNKILLMICIMLCFAFCMVTFTGCMRLPSVDDQTEQQILKFYSNDAVYPFSVDDYRIRTYYGNYNGAHVLILDDCTPHHNNKNATKVVVDGLTFDTTNDQLIRVFDGNNDYTLNQAYEQEIISQDDLKQIHKLFGVFGENYFDGKRLKVPTLPKNLEYETNCACYLGKYSGVHIYYTAWAGYDVITAMQIGSHNVYIDNSFALKAYVDGQEISFNQAQDKLSKKDLENLYNMIMYVGFPY